MIEFEPPKKSKIPAYKCPQKWEEVTTRQYFQFDAWRERGGSPVELLVIFTGIPLDTWLNAPADEVEPHYSQFLWTLKRPDITALPMPKAVEIDGVKYDVPKTLKSEPYGITLALSQAVDLAVPTPAEGEELNTEGVVMLVPYAVALVMEHRVSGKLFDEKRAKDFEEKINQLAALEVLPVGFTYLKSVALSVLSGRRHLATALTGMS